MTLLWSRWVQTLFGTALLGAVVWEFGPLLPPLEPWLTRVVAIQSMLVVWAVANALIDARRRSREASLSAGLVGSEADAVGATLARALSVLKKSGARATLTELPWYAIIGPPGAGKTTALLNAGLTFTIAEQMGQAAISGVGGTRLCEWWFTDRAVLIDTAGRYTTQDSNAVVDKAGWDAFLGLLKRTRPRQPLNGVIVAIALPDVVQATPAERDAHAAAIASRIAELQARFGIRMPVYALFTKADLVAGFMEFFDGLDREGRDQVWGETYPIAAGGPDLAARFGEGFRELVRRLNERLLPRLQAEHRVERRGAIAGFPTQVGSLEKPLAGFVAAAFPPATTWLRGVYLGSGTQEGTPIDRLTGAMARAFGIDQMRAAALRPESGRSYFLGHLLRDVIFGEAMLVRESPGAVRRRLLARGIGFAAILLAVAMAAGALVLSGMAGEREVAAVAAALGAYEQTAGGLALDPVADGELRPMLALLDQAESLTRGVPPDVAGFGMEQTGKLDAGAGQVYRDGLTFGLLPRLVWRLETQMRGSLGRPDALYQQTRIYLMLGGAGPIDPALVRNWMVQDWQEAYPAPEDAELRAGLLRHLDRLLAEPLPPITLDTALVTAARASFSRVPLADRVYASIRSSAAAAALVPWRPIDVLGLAGVQVFTRASGKPMTEGIPGFYSETGYRTVLRPSLGAATRQVAAEAWVTGRRTEFAPAELQDLETAVGTLYAADFTARWDGMLADLDIGPVTTIGQAAQAQYILASPESPLRALLQSVAAQVRLVPGAGGGGASPAVAVMAHFRPLIDLGAGDGAGLERSLRLVADVQQQLAKIAALPVGTALPPGGDDIGAAVLADAARQPQPLGRWLTAMAASAQALRTGNVRRQLALSWSAPGGAGPACQAALGNHYPFVPGGTPLSLGDFAHVFGPGGLLDEFFNTQLKPFVDTSAKPWKPQPSAPVAAADVAQFQRAAAIRDAFFAAGRAAPSVQLEITPVGAGAGRAVTLEVGGASIESGRGPAHAAAVTWPAPDPASTVSLSAEPSAAPLPLSEAGPWAMFRLFARGRLQPSAKPGRQVLTFAAGNGPIAYEMRVGDANPLVPGLMTEFRCPALQ